MPNEESPKKCGNRECHNPAGQPDKPRSLYCSKKCQSREQNLRQGRIKGTKKNKKGELSPSPLHNSMDSHGHNSPHSTIHHSTSHNPSPLDSLRRGSPLHSHTNSSTNSATHHGSNDFSHNSNVHHRNSPIKHYSNHEEHYSALKKKKVESPSIHHLQHGPNKGEAPNLYHFSQPYHNFISPEVTESFSKGRSPYPHPSGFNLSSLTPPPQGFPNFLSMTPSPTALPALLGDHESPLTHFSPLQLTSKPPNHPNIINPKAIKDGHQQQQHLHTPLVKREIKTEEKDTGELRNSDNHNSSAEPFHQHTSGHHNTNQSDTPTPGGSPFPLNATHPHTTQSPFPPRGVSPFGNSLPIPKAMSFDQSLDDTPLQEPPSGKNMRFRKTPTPPIPAVADFPDPNLCFSAPWPAMRRSVSPFSIARAMTPPNGKPWDGSSPLTVNPFGHPKQKLSIPEIPEIKPELPYNSYD